MKLASGFTSHVSLLQQAAKEYSDKVVFKIEIPGSTDDNRRWSEITYAQFFNEVESFAQRWLTIFNRVAIPPGSVIGLWLSGYQYTDALHIYAVSRAGFVPQVFSLNINHHTAAFTLLSKTQAKALIYEPSHLAVSEDIRGPLHLFPTTSIMREGGQSGASKHKPDVILPPIFDSKHNEDDVILIMLTSGSTSIIPGVVQYTRKWMTHIIRKLEWIMDRFKLPAPCDIWKSPICHLSQFIDVLDLLLQGSTLIQLSNREITSTLLIELIEDHGLNRFTRFGSHLVRYLEEAKTNRRLREVLRSLQGARFLGAPMEPKQAMWAQENGITVMAEFGSTECGVILFSPRFDMEHQCQLYYPVTPRGTHYDFVPTADNEKLVELVVRSKSQDCPHASLRASDGHFYTADLFEEVRPGEYRYHGRTDTRIKTLYGGTFYANVIEDVVKANCSDLIGDCIVLGSTRPTVALIAEVKKDVLSENQLKEGILQRLQPYQDTKLVHEKLTARTILFVKEGSLPRTMKGAIRRKMTDEMFKEQLDMMYAQ